MTQIPGIDMMMYVSVEKLSFALELLIWKEIYLFQLVAIFPGRMKTLYAVGEN